MQITSGCKLMLEPVVSNLGVNYPREVICDSSVGDVTPLPKMYARRHVFLLNTDISTKTGHLQTCRPYFCTSPIDITEVNFSNRLLWVIEDLSHQKWVMKKKGWVPLAWTLHKLIISVQYHQFLQFFTCSARATPMCHFT